MSQRLTLGLTLYDAKYFNAESVAWLVLLEVVLLSFNLKQPSDLRQLSNVSDLNEHHLVLHRFKHSINLNTFFQT